MERERPAVHIPDYEVLSHQREQEVDAAVLTLIAGGERDAEKVIDAVSRQCNVYGQDVQYSFLKLDIHPDSSGIITIESESDSIVA